MKLLLDRLTMFFEQLSVAVELAVRSTGRCKANDTPSFAFELRLACSRDA